MMSMLKKIVLFPISLFVAFLALMARWLLTLSSYVVAPLMLYIFGCGIYTAYRQTWDQFLILLVAEFICFILFFGATAITEGIGRFSEWLAYKTGPLLYKLKKPPRTPPQWEESSTVFAYRVCCGRRLLLSSAKNNSTFFCAFINSCISFRALR